MATRPECYPKSWPKSAWLSSICATTRMRTSLCRIWMDGFLHDAVFLLRTILMGSCHHKARCLGWSTTMSRSQGQSSSSTSWKRSWESTSTTTSRRRREPCLELSPKWSKNIYIGKVRHVVLRLWRWLLTGDVTSYHHPAINSELELHLCSRRKECWKKSYTWSSRLISRLICLNEQMIGVE